MLRCSLAGGGYRLTPFDDRLFIESNTLNRCDLTPSLLWGLAKGGGQDPTWDKGIRPNGAYGGRP
jgi:hypothetical protein